MSAPKPAKLRCAVYTRKSSDEGLEQNFNSLHAQREACEAYIQSQTHEGWTLVKGQYDDGGFSGGTMERPALKRLLADVEAGLVDTIVVYKVDRLTRSLHDFAKIVDVFDKAGASFVSITQAFNTTTSMGRLTLNVLLSFAQFEREVTGERIRDKIAQSKAKGMWMGGKPPLGYDPGDHTLVINEPEAETVRAIFRRYLELGSVYALQAELDALSIRSKVRPGKDQGEPFTRGALYHLLQNRHYIGLIPHKDLTFPGLHPAIVDPDVFRQVQATLSTNSVNRRERTKGPARAPLVGIVFDRDGGPYTPTFSTGRGGKSYRYYLGRGDAAGAPNRLPATDLERFVLAQTRRLTGHDDLELDQLRTCLTRVDVKSRGVELVFAAAALFGGDHASFALEDLNARLGAGERAIAEGEALVRVRLPVMMRFRGGKTFLDGAVAGEPERRKPNPALVRALKASHRLFEASDASPLDRKHVIGSVQAPGNNYLARLARLALLAPDIQIAILSGRQPEHLSLKEMIWGDLPVAWAEQRLWIARLSRREIRT